MSNVSVITPKVASPDIDVQAMNQAAKNMSRLAVFRSTEYEVLRNKAVRATGYAKEVDELARQSIPNLSTALRTLRGLGHFDTLHEIGQALKDTALGEEDRSALQSEYDNLAQSLAKEFSKAREQFYAEANKLDAKMEDVRDVLLSARTDEALSDEQNLKTELQQTLATQEAERAALQEDRKKIIEAQDILRKYNVADMFKDYIPSTKDLEKIGVTDPKIELIKQSIEITKKIVGNVGDGFRYIELADGRRALDKKIDGIDTALGELRTRLAEIEPRVSDLNAILKIEEERNVVLDEADKLVRTWKVFGDELVGGLAAEASQIDLQRPVERQLAFLEYLAQQYRKAIVT